MANPGNTQAQRLVNQLHSGGMSYAEIGRRIGRDSSYVSQIARKGNKGASIVPALQQIQGGATAVNVPRRTTKSGAQAGVRKGLKNVTTKKGKQHTAARVKRGPVTLKRAIGKASGSGGLRWDINFRRVRTTSDQVKQNAWVSGQLPEGWTAQDLLDRIENPEPEDNWAPGDVNGALVAIALEQNESSIVSASGPQEFSLFSTD